MDCTQQSKAEIWRQTNQTRTTQLVVGFTSWQTCQAYVASSPCRRQKNNTAQSNKPLTGRLKAAR